MSLLTDYLAAIALSTEAAKAEANSLAMLEAAKAEAAQKAVKANKAALIAERDKNIDRMLLDAGLASDYQELLEVEAEINSEYKTASTQVNAYQLMAVEAEIAADLVEKKAQSIESLVSMMEADGLLADQIEATKKGHLDSMVASHNAAKAAKDRIAKLLANKKIK
jgi:acetylglutamate synthase